MDEFVTGPVREWTVVVYFAAEEVIKQEYEMLKSSVIADLYGVAM